MSGSCGDCCTKINNISFTAGSDVILDNISLHIHCGSLTVLIGKNGAGKSTLLRALLGEIKHTGEIVYKNKTDNNKKIRIGYVPQNINIENSPMTVYDMATSFCYNKPVFLVKDKKIHEEIKEHLKEFGAENLIDSKVSRLSGGELQRVMMAIATIPYPDLLILDEPISGMDKNGKEQFYSRIAELKNEHDLAVILVSHDFDYVKKYADKVVMLDKKVVCEGTPDEVFNSEVFKETFGNV
jgi:zinc transport system ATP-binding protein